MGTPFLGEIKMTPYNFPQKGWAQCNGQLLPINQNQALFSLLGTQYGGNGQTTFALPDLRGRTPIHTGPNNSVPGTRGGEEAHTVTLQELPAHTHTVPASNLPATLGDPNGTVWASAVGEARFASESAFRGWLQVMTRNRLIDLDRRHFKTDRRPANVKSLDETVHGPDGSQRRGDAVPAAGPGPSTVIGRREIAEAIEDAIAHCRPKDRELIRLVLVDRLPISEIADRLGKKPAAVRKALSRALDASEQAQASAREAADGKARARSDAESAVSTTATRVQQLRSSMKSAEEARLPPAQIATARQTAQRVDAALQEARTKLAKEQYLDVVTDLEHVQAQIQAQITVLSDAIKARGGRRRR